MGRVAAAASEFVESIVGFVVMIVLAIIAFYFTVFVVVTGSAIAGQDPNGNFVVLSAALLVVAAILAGGLSPVSALSGMSNAQSSRSSANEPDEPVSVIVPSDDDATATESLGQFQVYRDRGGDWRWRLVHRNGNTIATSGEGYASRQNAEKGMRSVVTNAPNADAVVEG